MNELAFTPLMATVLFVLSCLFGYRYRRVWKAGGPKWQLWLFGLLTAGGLMALGFIPLAVPG